MLSGAGYDGTLAVQSASAMAAINHCFNTIPTILCFVMTLIVIFFYNMDKIRPTMKKELTERHDNEETEAVDNGYR